MSKEILNPLKIKKYWKNQQPPNIKELRFNKKNFVDKKYFPPNENSLTSKDENGNYIDSVIGQEKEDEIIQNFDGKIKILKWKRPQEVKPDEKWELFLDKIEFDDVKQGNIANCYFLTSLTALTKYPYIIVEKFRTKEFNDEGYYEMIFFIDGEWQIVFVDDYFPYNTLTEEWAFAKPNGNELWAMLLEKAWAKLNGGYSNIIGGTVSESICALTGFPSEHIRHKEKIESNYSEHTEFHKFLLFNIIEECDKNGYIISCGSREKTKENVTGIIPSHAYTLIETKRLDKDKIYLLKIRNPWGCSEWKGDWSDNSDCWTSEYKDYFGFEKKDNGIFWISVEDYFAYFYSTDICHILYGALIKNFYFEYKTYFEKPIIFNFCLREKCKASVKVLFRNWRFNRDIRKSKYPCTLVIGKYNEERKILSLYSKWAINEDIDFVKELTPGYYVIWIYLYYDAIKDDKNFKYTVQISSDKPFDVEFIGLDKEYKLLQYLLLENYMNEGADVLNSSKQYFFGKHQKFNKACLKNKLIYNKSGGIMEIKITCNYRGVFVFPPYTNKKNIKIILQPYERDAIIALPIDNSPSFSITKKIRLRGGDSLEKNNKNIIDYRSQYERFMKLNISNNSNPEENGLRIGEYKFIELLNAKEIPEFDKKSIISKKALRMSMIFKIEITHQILGKEYPTEIKLLLEKFPNDLEPKIMKIWDKIESEKGVYIGEVNSLTKDLEGRGIFIWKKGFKYIGSFKGSEISGKGIYLDKNNNLLFDGEFYNSKKNGRGKLYKNKNEYIEIDFVQNKMAEKGKYHYANGNIWEGFFLNNMRNGVGILTNKNNNELSLVEYENDYFIGSVPLNKEERISYENMKKSQLKRILETEKKKQEEEIINLEEEQINKKKLEEDEREIKRKIEEERIEKEKKKKSEKKLLLEEEQKKLEKKKKQGLKRRISEELELGRKENFKEEQNKIKDQRKLEEQKELEEKERKLAEELRIIEEEQKILAKEQKNIEEQRVIEEKNKLKEEQKKIWEKEQNIKKKLIIGDDIIKDIYFKKTLLKTSIIENFNDEIEVETLEEKKHLIFLENIKKFKEYEPFMTEEFLFLRSLYSL